MIFFSSSSSNVDSRRSLTPHTIPNAFQQPVLEITTIVVGSEESEDVVLGKHSHPYPEWFSLVKGQCVITTWTTENGKQTHEATGPNAFGFLANEEHVLACSPGTVLVGHSPVKFNPDNLILATHLS